MKTHLASHRSFWLRNDQPQQRFDALEGAHDTEILILGAGITGLSIAAAMLERGHHVTICEAQVIGAGTTAASSGHLDAHPEMGPKKLLDKLGTEAGISYVAARSNAIQKIESLAAGDCDFVRVPAWSYSESAENKDSLRKDFEAAKALGLDVEWSSQIPIPRNVCGYRIGGMARINSMAYLRRLTEEVVQRGGKIFEKTLVSGPSENHPRSLKAGNGEVSFSHAVSAVHCNGTDSMRLFALTSAYQSYLMAVRVSDPPPDALFWDHADPYHYVRRATSDDEELLLVGGADHRTGVGSEKEAMQRLEDWTRARFAVREVVQSWSAELFEPSDGLPMIGKVAGKANVWIATGLSGVGLTWGTASGELLADLIEEKPNVLTQHLSPARFGVSSAMTIVAEQATSAANLAKRVLPAANIDPAKLGPGEGAVGNVDGKHTAVCRDADGCEHRASPVCTHMGGVVQWNDLEETWDCPVHGGRFAADGTRIYGPPQQPLDPPK